MYISYILRTELFRKASHNNPFFSYRLFFPVLLISLIFFAGASHAGVRLTHVRHLFDITHNFSQPSDVSVSDEGLIYVVDGVNNKIKVFDADGTFRFSFGEKGSAHGQFRYPLGIDIDSSGKVYIADSGNGRIQIFTPDGKYLDQVMLPEKNSIKPDPTDVAVAESINRLYIADNNIHYFLIYDLSKFKLLETVGTPGTEDRQFRYPFLMALDRGNYLYISDVVNTRVQAFNPDGLFVAIIGGWGVEKGRFFRPKGIAVDTENLIYVSDSYIGAIQLFKANGEFHSVVGNPAQSSVRKFIKPMGIFIDKRNRLFVVEMFAERVGVYQIEKE